MQMATRLPYFERTWAEFFKFSFQLSLPETDFQDFRTTGKPHALQQICISVRWIGTLLRFGYLVGRGFSNRGRFPFLRRVWKKHKTPACRLNIAILRSDASRLLHNTGKSIYCVIILKLHSLWRLSVSTLMSTLHFSGMVQRALTQLNLVLTWLAGCLNQVSWTAGVCQD